MQTEDSLLRLSGENIIEIIKEHRNELVEKLMDESALKEYLSSQHHLHDLSSVKIEFIKRALKELMQQPVDLSHYSSLILEVRKKDLAVLSKGNEALFMADIERTIKNYL